MNYLEYLDQNIKNMEEKQ